MEEYQEAFGRIERAVEAGDTDLSGLGFWRLVRRIKVDPALSEHWADVVGRIDRMAFERRVRLRAPVWLGNAVLLAGTVVAAALVPVALAIARRSSSPQPAVAGALVVAAALGLSATVHVPAHWVVGRLGGMSFVSYFIGGPLRVTPGIKVDYASYLRATPAARATMHAAGALASKAAPFAVFASAYVPHARAGWGLLPGWSLWALLGVGALQIVTDVVWSRKVSDWKKVGRELRAGQARRA